MCHFSLSVEGARESRSNKTNGWNIMKKMMNTIQNEHTAKTAQLKKYRFS